MPKITPAAMGAKFNVVADAHDSIGAINGLFTGDTKPEKAVTEALKQFRLDNPTLPADSMSDLLSGNTLVKSTSEAIDQKASTQKKFHAFLKEVFFKGDLPEFEDKGNGKFEAVLAFKNAGGAVSPVRVSINADTHNLLLDSKKEVAPGQKNTGEVFANKIKSLPNSDHVFDVAVGKYALLGTNITPDFSQAHEFKTHCCGQGQDHPIEMKAIFGKDQMATYELDNFDLSMRSHQSDVFRQASRALAREGNAQTSLLVDAGTGTGKTGMIGHALSSLSSGKPGGGIILVPEDMVKECKEETPAFLPRDGQGNKQSVKEIYGLKPNQDKQEYLAEVLRSVQNETYVSMSHNALRLVMDSMNDKKPESQALANQAHEVFEALKSRIIAADESHQLTADTLDPTGTLVPNKHVERMSELVRDGTLIAFTGTPNNNLSEMFHGSQASISVNKVMSMGGIRPVAGLDGEFSKEAMHLKAGQQSIIGNNMIDTYRNNELARTRFINDVNAKIQSLKDSGESRKFGISDPSLVKGVTAHLDDQPKIYFNDSTGNRLRDPRLVRPLEMTLPDVIDKYTNVNMPNMIFADTKEGHEKVTECATNLMSPNNSSELNKLHAAQISSFLSDLGVNESIIHLAQNKDYKVYDRMIDNQRHRAAVGMVGLLKDHVAVKDDLLRKKIADGEQINIIEVVSYKGKGDITPQDIANAVFSLPAPEKEHVSEFLTKIVDKANTPGADKSKVLVEELNSFIANGDPTLDQDIARHRIHTVSPNTNESKAIIQAFSPQTIVSHDMLTTGYSNKNIMGVTTVYDRPITNEPDFGKFIQTIGRGIRDKDLVANNAAILSNAHSQFEVQINGKKLQFAVPMDNLFGPDASDIQAKVGKILAVGSREAAGIKVEAKDRDQAVQFLNEMKDKKQINEFVPLAQRGARTPEVKTQSESDKQIQNPLTNKVVAVIRGAARFLGTLRKPPEARGSLNEAIATFKDRGVTPAGTTSNIPSNKPSTNREI